MDIDQQEISLKYFVSTWKEIDKIQIIVQLVSAWKELIKLSGPQEIGKQTEVCLGPNKTITTS